MFTTGTHPTTSTSTRLRELAADNRDRLTDIAIDGIERSSDVVSRKAQDAADAARRWADQAADETTDLFEVSRSRSTVRRWLVAGAIVLTAAVGIAWITRIVMRRRAASDESSLRDVSEASDEAASERAEDGDQRAEADEHRAAS